MSCEEQLYELDSLTSKILCFAKNGGYLRTKIWWLQKKCVPLHQIKARA